MAGGSLNGTKTQSKSPSPTMETLGPHVTRLEAALAFASRTLREEVDGALGLRKKFLVRSKEDHKLDSIEIPTSDSKYFIPDETISLG